MRKHTIGLLLNVLMVSSLSCYSATKEGVTLSIVDYSKRPMTSFFSELSKECYISLLNLNLFTRLYPVRLIIANNSDKTYKLGPSQIGGTISVDYQKIITQMPLQLEGNGDYLVSVLGASEGICLAISAGMLTGVHHDSHQVHSAKNNVWEHIKACKTMKVATSVTVALGSIGIVSTAYAIAKVNRVNAERRKWLKKYALPQEGIVIHPKEQAEVIVFLTPETYNREHLMISLVEPGLGNTLDPFSIPLIN